MKYIIPTLIIAFLFSSCKPILKLLIGNAVNDTEGMAGVESLYNDDNIVFKTNSNFIYTECAPFPEVRFPLESNKKWTNELLIPKGSYEKIVLGGSKVQFYYTAIGTENIATRFRNFENCWKIESFGESNLGKSKHVFYFDKQYGFVSCQYSFPNGEMLVMELVDCRLGNK